MRFLWVHGFASGQGSSKGRFAKDRLHERGVDLAIPDFNEPSFFDLTVSRMLARIDDLAGNEEPAVLFGSSLGGFAAATWAARMGVQEVAQWRRRGRYACDHYARGRKEE